MMSYKICTSHIENYSSDCYQMSIALRLLHHTLVIDSMNDNINKIHIDCSLIMIVASVITFKMLSKLIFEYECEKYFPCADLCLDMEN